MYQRSRAVLGRTCYRDLEFTGQVGEFRMKRRPLANDLAPGPRIFEFIGRDPGQMIGCNVANAIAAGLDGVHLHLGEFLQNIRHLLKLGPVELQILAGREMSVASIIVARNFRQGAQLPRRQQPVGNGDAQHRRVSLDVQAVAQSQMLEFVLAQRSLEESLGLVAKLRHPLAHQSLVGEVVPIHGKHDTLRAPNRANTHVT